MKINTRNAEKVLAALLAVNGKATEHTYGAGDIEDLVSWAETRLEKLGIPKTERVGAGVVAISGDSVVRAFRFPRQATGVRLERDSSGWFAVEITRETIWENGGKCALVLTPEQDEVAVKHLRAGYDIHVAPIA